MRVALRVAVGTVRKPGWCMKVSSWPITAVNNQQLLPMFNLLDQAQRNNRVGTLRAEDVTNVMGGPAAQVIAPIVNVQAPDNEELIDTLATVRETQDRLATQLEQGIGVDIPIDGENGIYRQMKRYENLLKNK